ncbi:putative disease resistance protein RGA3 [Magnolia sinica]|uniref:putative disease resistance protein RGA3 n=1 Tax=Magnolia sinica TaxID=86752 RepID=UPI002659E599|nr:putative disease resistance protein RGA3 [Magnolia sinica]
MVDWLVSTAVEKLNTILQGEVAMLVGFTDEIEKLSSTFTLIQGVLEDAESRRVKNGLIKIWLEKVKDVAYDVDDVLDEWKTEALRLEAANESDGSYFIKKVRSFFSRVPFFNYVELRYKFGSRIKEVRDRLDDIDKEKSQLGLRVYSGESAREDREVRQSEIRERETGSQLDRSSIVGREVEKDEVIDLLLQEVNDQVPIVISIIGMGGLGKTTLAQLAYNDDKVKMHFELRMWVCVSDDFDVKRITKSIIESATGSSCAHLDLDPLQNRLHKMLLAKRFLLVLDDIWSEDGEKWDKLRLPFQPEH